MRHIGTIAEEREAKTFADYVLTLGVKAMVEQENDEWAIWIYDEDDVERAKNEFKEFRESPQESRFHEAAKTAATLREDTEKKRKQVLKKQVNVRQRWDRPLAEQCPVTFSLIGLSVIVAVMATDWNTPFRLCDRTEPVLTQLFVMPIYEKNGKPDWDKRAGLEAVRHGEVWRLVTPMLIHFNLLHIFFNMLWLRDLGTMIETRRGKLKFLLMVLTIAVLSNLGQYLHRYHPLFGGMSGVVFGLFGYIWMKSRFDPRSGFQMHPNTIFLMMAWFVICFTGAIGNIANTAHGVGLVVGLAMGYAPKLLKDLQRA